MERLTGSFKVMNWEEHPYDDATGMPMLAHATVTHELTGDIEGEASITYLLAYDSNHVRRPRHRQVRRWNRQELLDDSPRPLHRLPLRPPRRRPLRRHRLRRLVLV